MIEHINSYLFWTRFTFVTQKGLELIIFFAVCACTLFGYPMVSLVTYYEALSRVDEKHSRFNFKNNEREGKALTEPKKSHSSKHEEKMP